jgi:FkbM family methyltransferase
MSTARNLLKRVVPSSMVAVGREINRNWLMSYAVKSFSQEGEDVLLSRMFVDTKSGFYVDIGAHHPVHFSNTFLFYRRGWRGINIDPTPGSRRLFERRRPRDTTLELGISAMPGTLTFHVFDNAVLNTFDEAEKEISVRRGYRLKQSLEVPVLPLAHVLERHLPPGQGIDFMSIDVEGHEAFVIQSNDWGRFRPNVLCLEMLHSDIDAVRAHPVALFLEGKNYVFFAKLNNTLFFRDREFQFV